MEKIEGVNPNKYLVSKVEKITPVVQVDNNKKPKQEKPKEPGKGDFVDITA